MTQTNPHLRNMTFNETFESSLIQKNNEKFSVDKSLIKGIKENDVSKIIDQNQVRGQTENSGQYDEVGQLSGIVIDTRKRYDEKKTQSIRSEQEIEKLKSQKEILLGDQSKLGEMIDKQKKDLDQTAKRLQQITSLMQTTTYRKDIYSQIKDTVKQDLLVLKKRYFDLDVKLMRDSTKLKTLKTEHQSKFKLSKRCRDMLDSVEKSVQVKQLERTTKIQSFCDVLNRKQANQQNRQIRQREIQQAIISAMTDKLAQEKQWIRMFNANLFLKGLLKSKMEVLMNKFSKTELSFHKMKQATSIKDSNQFIQKFLNRQETYGLLLQSISDKQKHLQDLKEERDQLQKIYNNYLYKNQEINGEQKNKVEPKKGEQGPNLNTTLHILNQQLLSISRQQQLMYQWGVKFLAAFNGHQTRDKITNKYPKNMKKQLIIQTLKTINKFLEDLQKQQNHQKKIEQAFLKNTPKQNILNEEMFQRNTRIKTLSTVDPDGGADTFQDKDMAYDDLSEADFLQYNRRAIKKNDMNRKFRIKTKPY